MVENSQVDRRLLVCQNRTCRKQGSAKVLAAFESSEVPNIQVEKSGCLGQCGNGPMVLVLPEEVWYSHVHIDEVSAVVERHLLGGVSVKKMLYSKFHCLRRRSQESGVRRQNLGENHSCRD
ncbi:MULTISPECIES: ferredoxin [Okeania]|uniref:(2Fe-2S) ferredoxin domain-containing protein n=1 Tax=Okeania TaxID=1458928 RepID=UPI000F53A8A5|nr:MULTISPECIES: (2Fe-2S) ferredoxin domain-containing protein [Okeania]NET13154.1 (2Fe-2S) ferredoxin domain-containing protein [Okeania sp. SIO1H6]NEP90411.1 (2Fe-2S) ferredoxin domain-containing protein [Okeania sp. SIO2C2]NES78570.1 (2Fe-2S) ferredoxin domain-containing protein [Okeania sp. SIO1H4]NES90710.1 (2Fe-2S) ferredoxin domain-containing protein [Okeania sp. SIO2B9]NET21979.1 (2Fe-2S) ferredoxin domain-containing protein [Okeania sp. SIO1H5]